MIYIIHGEDTVSSRNFFIDEKKKAQDAVSFDEQSLSLSSLVQNIEGGSLFTNEKTIFIENFLSKRAGDEELVLYIQKHHEVATLYFFEGKELSVKQKNIFPQAKVHLFKLPQKIFSFLDELAPGRRSQIIFLYHNLLKTVDADFIFRMIIRQIRLLLFFSENSSDELMEVKNMQPWQRKKMEKQAALFSPAHLKSMYKKLSVIDTDLKTGNNSFPLPALIDFFLADL